MVAESLARSQRDFDDFLAEKLDMDWEDQRRRIFQHFGLMRNEEDARDALDTAMKGSFGRSMKRSKQRSAAHNPPSVASRSVFGRSSLAKSVIGDPAIGSTGPRFFEDPTDRAERRGLSHFQFYREKMAQYAEKVQRLNLARVQGFSFPILHEFSDVERKVGGDVSY